MHWPQITYLILLAIGGTISLFLHGQEVKINFIGWIFRTIAMLTILYYGGFFG